MQKLINNNKENKLKRLENHEHHDHQSEAGHDSRGSNTNSHSHLPRDSTTSLQSNLNKQFTGYGKSNTLLGPKTEYTYSHQPSQYSHAPSHFGAVSQAHSHGTHDTKDTKETKKTEQDHLNLIHDEFSEQYCLICFPLLSGIRLIAWFKILRVIVLTIIIIVLLFVYKNDNFAPDSEELLKWQFDVIFLFGIISQTVQLAHYISWLTQSHGKHQYPFYAEIVELMYIVMALMTGMTLSQSWLDEHTLMKGFLYGLLAYGLPQCYILFTTHHYMCEEIQAHATNIHDLEAHGVEHECQDEWRIQELEEENDQLKTDLKEANIQKAKIQIELKLAKDYIRKMEKEGPAKKGSQTLKFFLTKQKSQLSMD